MRNDQHYWSDSGPPSPGPDPGPEPDPEPDPEPSPESGSEPGLCGSGLVCSFIKTS